MMVKLTVSQKVLGRLCVTQRRPNPTRVRRRTSTTVCYCYRTHGTYIVYICFNNAFYGNANFTFVLEHRTIV